MDRWACIHVVGLPLQLLLKSHPDWQELPVAVVDEDRPQGEILSVNKSAFRLGIRPGQRFQEGLSLSGELRAQAVLPQTISDAVETLCQIFLQVTPHVEPAADEPGVFWLDASGLERLYGKTPSRIERDNALFLWAQKIELLLKRAGFRAAICIGFERFGSYVVAKKGRLGTVIFDQATDERATAERILVHHLGFAPVTCAQLSKLGIYTVGEFLRLPAAAIERRWGEAAVRLWQWAQKEHWLPLRPKVPVKPYWAELHLDDAEQNQERLLFLLKQLVDSLLPDVQARGEHVAEICFTFQLEETGKNLQKILRPASPTREPTELLGLLRLCLETLQFSSGVIRIELWLKGVRETGKNRELFDRPRRDLSAANRALGRIRAACGEASVVSAVLHDGHLPEAQYSWQPLSELSLANPVGAVDTPLVRRIGQRAELMATSALVLGSQGLMLQGGAIERLVGPYLFSGGWWNQSIERDYYFAELKSGELLWVYYDHRRHTWFLQGQVS